MSPLVPQDWLAWSMLLWTFARIGVFFLLLYVLVAAADRRRHASDVSD